MGGEKLVGVGASECGTDMSLVGEGAEDVVPLPTTVGTPLAEVAVLLLTGGRPGPFLADEVSIRGGGGIGF